MTGGTTGGTTGDGTGDPPGETVRLTALASGRVQGVGFRWWARERALALRLTGAATNLADGRVEVVAEGPRSQCERLLAALRGPDAPGRVSAVAERWSSARGAPGFSAG